MTKVQCSKQTETTSLSLLIDGCVPMTSKKKEEEMKKKQLFKNFS